MGRQRGPGSHAGESDCDPDAIGDLSLTYQGSGRREGMSCGLMQVRVLAGRPDCAALLDPTTNVANAWRIYEARGSFAPWSVYTSGEYEQFL
ncbi:hypothetical protein [Rathayibacter festucae]|uniref:hypothetical protein n=1 Tax=Rathayibacter festucae TaxID=110937 RepID=UPI0035580BBC